MGRINAKQVADTLGFTITNLKHYASLLEQNGLEIYRNTRNHREYTQQDVKILRTMQHLNREKSMSLEDAASFVMSSDINVDDILAPKTSPIVAKNNTNISVLAQGSDNNMRLLTELSSLLTEQKALREEIHARDIKQAKFIKEIQQTFEEIAGAQVEQHLNNFQKRLSSPEQQRIERFNMLIAERKIVRELEKEALSLWSEKPIEERLIKVGWFRKGEDTDKRNLFIKGYIDEHFESRMKKEYGLN
jgi:DNA-binding transcriptional MerR regulator